MLSKENYKQINSDSSFKTTDLLKRDFQSTYEQHLIVIHFILIDFKNLLMD